MITLYSSVSLLGGVVVHSLFSLFIGCSVYTPCFCSCLCCRLSFCGNCTSGRNSGCGWMVHDISERWFHVQHLVVHVLDVIAHDVVTASAGLFLSARLIDMVTL